MEVLEPVIEWNRTTRKQISEELYKASFPAVAGFVSKMKGSFQDAKDIFHDALVIYYEKVDDSRLVISSAPEAYILGIAKHLWLRKFKHDHKNISLDSAEQAITIPEDYYPDVNMNYLLQLLERSGKKCMDLLRAFYHGGSPVKKIADEFGFSTEHSATVQKYKCLEKVRAVVKEKSITYEDFLE